MKSFKYFIILNIGILINLVLRFQENNNIMTGSFPSFYSGFILSLLFYETKILNKLSLKKAVFISFILNITYETGQYFLIKIFTFDYLDICFSAVGCGLFYLHVKKRK